MNRVLSFDGALKTEKRSTSSERIVPLLIDSLPTKFLRRRKSASK